MTQKRNRKNLGLWANEQELMTDNIGIPRRTKSVESSNVTKSPSGRIVRSNNKLPAYTQESEEEEEDADEEQEEDDVEQGGDDDDMKIDMSSNKKQPPPFPPPMTVKKRRGRPPKNSAQQGPTAPSTANRKKVVEEEEEEVSEEEEPNSEEEEVNSEEEEGPKKASAEEFSHSTVEYNLDIEKFKMSSTEEKLAVEYSIEKILDRRVVKNDFNNASSGSKGFDASLTSKEQFLLKWKDLAYMHSSWVDRALLERSRSGKIRLKRFLNTYSANESKNTHHYDDDMDYSDDADQFSYLDHYEVDRILDERTSTQEYLVKWKLLSYDQATWEKREDLSEDEAIRAYHAGNVYPSAKELDEKPRPPPSAFSEFKETPAFFKSGNQLRPYQLEGLNWLNFSYHERRNTILGDEMGLGKTVQSVSILETIRKMQGIRGPFLCIAPLTTIPHWKREFENWTDMNVLVYHDSGTARPLLRHYEFYYRDPKKGGAVVEPKQTKFNVLITTYEMAISDRAYLNRIKWRYLVIDEAHRLKNQSCRLTTDLKTYQYDHLLLLTGTPLQNNMQELWALLNFADAKTFHSLPDFMQEFGNLQDAEQVAKLQMILKPYLLRRMKENVEKSIAPKEETIVEVELTTIQKKYYRAIYERNFGFLKKGCKGQGPSLLNIMMELRKCCNHPYLIKGVEQSETQFLKGEQVFQKLIQASGKLVLIDKLLPKLQQGNHKVLIFSQMVGVLNILDDYLTFRGYAHERIDGSVKSHERQAAIDRFSKPDSNGFVFLLCTRAGGIGINLTAADTVIIFDSDWNPQNDLQAQARCHRIGQDKMVKVYRLVTRNTYERLMFDKASKKLGLDRAVLTKMNNSFQSMNSNDSVPNKETINSLLKYGVYAIKDDDQSSEKFYEEDIDKILDRSSTVIKHESIDPMETSFSTATFCSSSSVPSIDVNDPNFWDKFKPELERPDEVLKPRTRRSLQKFGSHIVDEFDMGDDEEDEEKSETPMAEIVDQANGSAKGYKGWTPTERTRMKAILLLFGSGRWDLIRYLAEITNWSIDQCRQFGKAMVAKIISEYEKEHQDVKLTLDSFDALVPSLEPMVLKYYIDNELEQQAQFEANKKAKPSTGDAVVAEDEQFQFLPKDHIQYDPTGKITVTPNDEDPSTANGFIHDASITDSYFNSYLKRNVNEVVRKLTNMAMLAQILRIGYPNLASAVGELSGDSPFPWWRSREDNDLLIGTYKHGFGQYEEIRNDPDLCFSSYKWTDPETMQDDSDSDEAKVWPNSKLLSHRVKRLLKQLESYKKNLEKENKNEKKQAEKSKAEEKKKKRQEEWTKKEKADFYKFLLIFGTYEEKNEYSWAVIKEKASLKKKSPELIEKYYFELLKKFNQASQQDDGSNTTFIPGEEISIIQYKKLVNRVFFLSKIRNHILKYDKLEGILQALQPPQFFPQWWVSGAHDLALIRGTAKHGYLQLEDICYDPTLPFYSVGAAIELLNPDPSEDPTAKKRRFKESILDLIQFPKDKLVIKRLDYIVDTLMLVIQNGGVIPPPPPVSVIPTPMNTSTNGSNPISSSRQRSNNTGNSGSNNSSSNNSNSNSPMNFKGTRMIFTTGSPPSSNISSPITLNNNNNNYNSISNISAYHSGQYTNYNPNSSGHHVFVMNNNFNNHNSNHSNNNTNSVNQSKKSAIQEIFPTYGELVNKKTLPSVSQINTLLNSNESIPTFHKFVYQNNNNNNNNNHNNDNFTHGSNNKYDYNISPKKTINVLPDKQLRIDDLINSNEKNYDDDQDDQNENHFTSRFSKKSKIIGHNYLSNDNPPVPMNTPTFILNHNNNNNNNNNNNGNHTVTTSTTTTVTNNNNSISNILNKNSNRIGIDSILLNNNNNNNNNSSNNNSNNNKNVNNHNNNNNSINNILNIAPQKRHIRLSLYEEVGSDDDHDDHSSQSKKFNLQHTIENKNRLFR